MHLLAYVTEDHVMTTFSIVTIELPDFLGEQARW